MMETSSTKSHPQVSEADGITIDNATYTILVDTGSQQVQVYIWLQELAGQQDYMV